MKERKRHQSRSDWKGTGGALLFIVLVLVLPRSAHTQNSAALTLQEAVQIALAQHPDVEKARAAADLLKGRIREVRAQAFPEVNFGANVLRWRDPSLLNASGLDKFPEELRNALVPTGVNLFDYSLRLKQPLYTAGKVGTALKLASTEAEGAAIDIDRAKQDLALEVVKAFLGLLWAEHARDLAAETQQQRKQHAEMARTRFRNGVATEVDVLRSEVNVANGAPELVRAENAIRQARALLNFYLVRPTNFATRAVGKFEEKPWTPTDLNKLTDQAINNRPELLRLRINERSAATLLDLARAESRMRLDFTSSYGVTSRLPDNLLNPLYTGWTVGLNFTLPVFDGFRRSGLVEQALASERTALLERQRSEQQVRLSVQQGLDELTAAHETILSARANIGQAERVLLMTQNNYKYGAATTLDIVDAQTALSVARTNLLRGLFDHSVARAHLLWVLGEHPWE
ncbi:MAG TPA: TolC family protein [Terriglobia bacterium]|nr:TolC family protein [Terriglobia bacterium]